MKRRDSRQVAKLRRNSTCSDISAWKSNPPLETNGAVLFGIRSKGHTDKHCRGLSRLVQMGKAVVLQARRVKPFKGERGLTNTRYKRRSSRGTKLTKLPVLHFHYHCYSTSHGCDACCDRGAPLFFSEVSSILWALKTSPEHRFVVNNKNATLPMKVKNSIA